MDHESIFEGCKKLIEDFSYTAGSKAGSGNPAGLLRRSENNMAQGVIVSIILVILPIIETNEKLSMLP